MGIEPVDQRGFGVLLLIFSMRPRIADRTQIQKLAYIMNECGWRAINDFKFIGRGPYSQWIDSQLDTWRDAGVLEEVEESILIGTDDEIGFFCYSLTTEGKSLARNILDSINEPKLVDKTSRLLSKLSKSSEQDLEIASSILYLRQEKDLDSEGIVRRILSYKPEFREEDVRNHLFMLEYAKENVIS